MVSDQNQTKIFSVIATLGIWITVFSSWCLLCDKHKCQFQITQTEIVESCHGILLSLYEILHTVQSSVMPVNHI